MSFYSLRAGKCSGMKHEETSLRCFIITQDISGRIVDYETVGYVAMAANALAIWFVARIAMHDPHAVVLDVAPK